MVVAALIAAFIAVFANVQAQRATNTQLRIAEQGQITDRYNAAINNLGARSIDVRLGGIYALQRLMKDSPPDQPTVIAVVCAFVRDRASRSTKPPNFRPPADIQAALTVVGTRDTAKDGRATVVDFDHAELAMAQLSDLHLSGANFSDADLHTARLIGADLRGTDFLGADLRGTDFLNADLRGTDFLGADLRGTDFINANLRGTDLTRANLRGAYLLGADLRGTDLRGVNFRGVDLNDAKWPKNFPAPGGWVRDSDSGRLKRART